MDTINFQCNDIAVAKPDSLEARYRKKYNSGMLRCQAFKYELMPDGQQRRQMHRFVGLCRLDQANNHETQPFHDIDRAGRVGNLSISMADKHFATLMATNFARAEKEWERAMTGRPEGVTLQ